MKILKKYKAMFLIIIVVGIAVRIYNFPTALKEMNCDEIMSAVNAKAIADTTKDINGISFPVYLQGWGGQSVVLIYLMVLSIKIIGYSLFSVRLPLLLVSIISMFVFYDFVKKISKDESIALIGLSLVSISPWHILQSIWALDCNMLPHFLLFAIDLLYTSITKKKKFMLYLSMFFFSITLYCYGVAIYFVPLFLLIMAIYLLKTNHISIGELFVCMMIFLIFSAPIITMFGINVLVINKNIKIGNITIPYYESLTRTKDMIFFTDNKLSQLGQNIISTLKVIFFQVDGAQWNSSKLFGTTYRITILFSVIGLITMIKRLKQNRQDIVSFMIILWLGISVLTGVIINEANINRLNSIWYVLITLGAFGIYEIYKKIRFKNSYKYGIIAIYSVIFIAYCIYFHTYYTKIVDNSGCFSRGFYQSLNYIKNIDKEYVWYDNIINDGNLKLYIDFNKDDNKQYKSITNKEMLEEKIKNLKDNEIVIVDIKNKNNFNVNNSYRIGNYMIITN